MNTVLTSRLKVLIAFAIPGIVSGCMGLSTSPNWRYTDPARLSPERYPVQAPQLPNRPIPVQPGQPSPVDILPPDSPDTYAEPDAASTYDSNTPGSDTIETQRPSGELPEIDPEPGVYTFAHRNHFPGGFL